MSRLLTIALLAITVTPLMAQRRTTFGNYPQQSLVGPMIIKPPPLKQAEVDSAEIARWGNRVVVTDGIQGKSPEDILFSMAMAPPVDDNDMWQLAIFGPSNDSATLGVIRAFEHDPSLAPYVAPPPGGGKAWAHLTVIHTNDVMQDWRIKQFGIDPRTCPTVILQAPRNGHKGNPQIVIDKIDLGGGTSARAAASAQALAKRLNASVTLWNKKLAAQGFQTPKEAIDNFYGPKDRVPSPTVGAKEEPVIGSSSELGLGQVRGPVAPWGPVAPPAVNPTNPQWPVNGPAQIADDTLDLAKIQTLCPGAPPEFLMSVMSAKPTDPNLVSMMWLKYQMEHKLAPGVPAVAPTEPVVPMVPGDWLTWVASISMVVIAFLKSWEVVAPLFGFSGQAAKLLEQLLTTLQKQGGGTASQGGSTTGLIK